MDQFNKTDEELAEEELEDRVNKTLEDKLDAFEERMRKRREEEGKQKK